MGDYTVPEQGEIAGDLQQMYRAGSQDFPAKADQMSDLATDMAGVIGTVNAQLSKMNFPGVGTDTLEIMSECHAGIRGTVGTLNDIGAAVVAIANDFVARDEYASSVFADLDAELKEPNRQVTPPAELPTDLGRPYHQDPDPSGPYNLGDLGYY